MAVILDRSESAFKGCVFGVTDFVVSSSDISRPAPYHSQKHLERNHGA